MHEKQIPPKSISIKKILETEVPQWFKDYKECSYYNNSKDIQQIECINKPRATEFNGVLFKSKSEAQFAYLLLNSNIGFQSLIYEPKEFKNENGYQLDFVVFGDKKILLIEYKPKEPTETYYKYFMDNCKQFDLGIFKDYVQFDLIYGNVYDGYYYNQYGVGIITAFTPHLINQAKNYRFDLK